MECCGCDGYAAPFDAEEARKDRKRYHADGPDETSRLLHDMVGPEAASGATVLDIGGGIGVIDQELLRRGASRAVLVDASPAYLEAAREEASDAGLLDRSEIMAGDFVRRADDVEDADIVTLDRVVCCYRAVDELVPASAARARRRYGLVLPRSLVRPLAHPTRQRPLLAQAQRLSCLRPRQRTGRRARTDRRAAAAVGGVHPLLACRPLRARGLTSSLHFESCQECS